mgnify:FL=1
MKIIDFDTIKSQGFQPLQCIEWVDYILKHKYDCQLPPKISLHMGNNIFLNTMPSYIPMIHRFGVKLVTRYPERIPSLLSEIMLYDATDGTTLALMDGTWITAMRTGAVAALTIKTLQSSKAKTYAFMGLGNTARSTLLGLTTLLTGQDLYIKLLAYKGQEILFQERFKNNPHLHFNICPDTECLISDSDVVVSCITAADHIIAPDKCFKEGVLVVPVHTRGFQNCDLFFDKVFADDTGHVQDFKYFKQFKQFDEFSRVLLGENPGRENDQERILAYNIGISLHDIYFASQIYDTIVRSVTNLSLESEVQKFWI